LRSVVGTVDEWTLASLFHSVKESAWVRPSASRAASNKPARRIAKKWSASLNVRLRPLCLNTVI